MKLWAHLASQATSLMLASCARSTTLTLDQPWLAQTRAWRYRYASIASVKLLMHIWHSGISTWRQQVARLLRSRAALLIQLLATSTVSPRLNSRPACVTSLQTCNQSMKWGVTTSKEDCSITGYSHKTGLHTFWILSSSTRERAKASDMTDIFTYLPFKLNQN